MHLVTLEDAGTLLQKSRFEELSFLDDIFCNIRKGLIHLIYITHSPAELSPGILSNTSNKIVFMLNSGRDREAMQRHMGITDTEQKEYFSKLNQDEHEVIIEFTRRARPFAARIMKIELVEQMSRKEIYENNERIMRNFSKPVPREIVKHEESKVDNKEIALARNLLNDIYCRPFISSTNRAYDFHLSNEKAKRIYHYIESQGYAEPLFFNITGRGGQSKFYWINENGCNLIQEPCWERGSGGKSNLHVFVQRFIEDVLGRNGFLDVEIEKDIEGKKIDLFCVKDGQSLGIEICISTFKTEFLNVVKDKGKCDRLVIVCIDNNAKKKVIEELRGLKDSTEVYAIHEFLKAL